MPKFLPLHLPNHFNFDTSYVPQLPLMTFYLRTVLYMSCNLVTVKSANMPSKGNGKGNKRAAPNDNQSNTQGGGNLQLPIHSATVSSTVTSAATSATATPTSLIDPALLDADVNLPLVSCSLRQQLWLYLMAVS